MLRLPGLRQQAPGGSIVRVCDHPGLQAFRHGLGLPGGQQGLAGQQQLRAWHIAPQVGITQGAHGRLGLLCSQLQLSTQPSHLLLRRTVTLGLRMAAQLGPGLARGLPSL